MKIALRTFVMTTILGASLLGGVAAAQTPGSSAGCDHMGTPAANDGMMDHGQGGHDDHGMSTPEMMHDDHGMATPGMMHDVEFDLMYIDMMIPHHESIIALAEVAQHELTHPRLIEIAEDVIEFQSAENEAMMELRDEWYGDAAPVSMDMMMGMPGMGTDMEMMNQQMSAEWQVETFCAAEDKDLAFIEQVIPHHHMAIDSSEAALEQAVHPELVAIAELVITAQEQEIEELEAIRAELTGEATPAA